MQFAFQNIGCLAGFCRVCRVPSSLFWVLRFFFISPLLPESCPVLAPASISLRNQPRIEIGQFSIVCLFSMSLISPLRYSLLFFKMYSGIDTKVIYHGGGHLFLVCIFYFNIHFHKLHGIVYSISICLIHTVTTTFCPRDYIE